RTVDRSDTHGADFSFRHNADIFTISEIGYLYNQREDSSGLPGNYKLGGYYDAGPFPDLREDDLPRAQTASPHPPHLSHKHYGFYALVDQQVSREVAAKDSQGLTLFAGATFAPPDINTFPFFFMGGGVYHGPIPGRDDDIVGFGLTWGEFSDDISTARRR